MEMRCADCGCVVDAGVRLVCCDDPSCCCAHLPVRDEGGTLAAVGLGGVECSCCGKTRDLSMVAALQCHPDTRICRVCLGWLLPRAGALTVTPTLPVIDMDATVSFYEAAGFDVERYDA